MCKRIEISKTINVLQALQKKQKQNNTWLEEKGEWFSSSGEGEQKSAASLPQLATACAHSLRGPEMAAGKQL